jgi:hypothetical protein
MSHCLIFLFLFLFFLLFSSDATRAHLAFFAGTMYPTLSSHGSPIGCRQLHRRSDSGGKCRLNAYEAARWECILQAMKNQVTDLGGVLRHVAVVLSERQQNNITDESLALLQHHLAQTESKLKEVDCLLIRIIGPPGNPRKSVGKAAIWLKEKGKLQLLQQDLRVLKSNLNMAMGSSHS